MKVAKSITLDIEILRALQLNAEELKRLNKSKNAKISVIVNEILSKHYGLKPKK